MTENKFNPSKTSSDYTAMEDYWSTVRDILGGAAHMRRAGEKYLPQFENEGDGSYGTRRDYAKFTNIFRDIVENLAARPFSEEVQLGEDTTEEIRDLAMDIDGRGSSLHTFASSTFFNGIANSIQWIMVDYTRIATNLTREQERAANARPYWIHVSASRLLAVYSAMENGREVLVHVRMSEDKVERSGVDEIVRKRVRVIDRKPSADGTTYAEPVWTLYEEIKNTKTGSMEWLPIDNGVYSIGIIPLVPFVTGQRIGSTWQIVPPMMAAVDLQIEHYQQESGLKYIRELTCFPMLSGNGVTPATGKDGNPLPVPVGPKQVLYAPPNADGNSGSWNFIEPTAASLTFLASDIQDTARELRELGRQPLTAQSGNLTVITTAFASSKGNTAIQAWALNLANTLADAMRITAMWLSQPDLETTVKVHTDFDLGVGDEKGPSTLLEMRRDGDLSQRTLWEEMRRRNVLSPDFDPESEENRILEEIPGEDSGENPLAV